MTELAQAVAAILLQEPDHARARPSRYFKKEFYGRVFSPKYPIDLYVACAILRNKAELFLRAFENSRRDRNNLIFYLLMVVVCIHFRAVRTGARLLTSSNAESVSSPEFDAALTMIRKVYEELGPSDNTAKGTEMLSRLKAELLVKFGKKKPKKSL